MAACLSHLIGIGVMDVMVSLSSSLHNQANPTTNLLKLLYFGSVEEWEMVPCFFDFQDTKLLPKKMVKPLTDLLV